jgi:hypothetical protein
MEISQIIKYVGFLTTAISAVVALLGKPREKGKFTKQGRILLFTIAVGLITSIASEVYQSREAEGLRRIDQEWEYLKSEKITFAEVEFFTTGQAKAINFVQFANLTHIDLKNTHELDSTALKFRMEQTGNPGITIRLIADQVSSDSIISSEQAKLFTLELHNNELRALYDYPEKSFTSDTTICGISSKIAWQDLRIKGITTIMDLINLDISISKPEEYNFQVELLGNYDPNFFFVINIQSLSHTFRIDPSIMNFRVVKDDNNGTKHMTASLNGSILFHLLKKQFYENQKRREDPSKEKGELHVIKGIPKHITEIRVLRKL